MLKSPLLALLCALAVLVGSFMILHEEDPSISDGFANAQQSVVGEAPAATSMNRRTVKTKTASAEPEAKTSSLEAETNDSDSAELTPQLARLQRIVAAKVRSVGLDDQIVLDADAARLEELQKFSSSYFEERAEVSEKRRKLLSKRVDEKVASNQIEIVRSHRERKKDLPDQYVAMGTRYVDGKPQDFIIRVSPGEVPEADALRREVKALDDALGRDAHRFLWAAARGN